MPKILVVDDDTYRDQVAQYFILERWEAAASPSSMDAQRRLDDEHFDGVIIDRRMPGLSGDELLKWIAEQPRLRHLCVVMLTAYGTVASAVDSLKLGAWQFLVKGETRLADIKSVLSAGVAWKRCHLMRAQLITSLDRQLVLSGVREIVNEAVAPHGFRVLYVPKEKDGRVTDWGGGHFCLTARPEFVNRILQGSSVVHEVTRKNVIPLGPIIPEARSLMAVPVLGEEGAPVGVLDMESLDERAFDPWWKDLLRDIADIVGLAATIEHKVAERHKAELARMVLEAQLAKQQAEHAKIEAQLANDKAERAKMDAQHQAEQVKMETEHAKMAQLGIVYQELRHRIGTHSQIISMQGARLKSNDKIPKSAMNRIEIIDRNAQAIDAAVRDLREISKPLRLRKSPLDLAESLREAVRGLEPRFELAQITPTWGQMAEPACAEADREWLFYCVESILENAADAIEQRRREDPAPSRFASDTIAISLKNKGSRHTIEITDTGIGFDEDVLQKLFQPTFSTKTIAGRSGAAQENRDAAQETSGTDTDIPDRKSKHGIALYTVRRVLLEHGGEVQAYSGGLYQGATFTLTLPGNA